MKKFHYKFHHLLSCCLLAGACLLIGGAKAGTENQAEDVSLINLIATPERYDGRLVLVTGYVTVGLENMSICLMKVKLSSKDCLWLNVDSGPYETLEDEKRINKKMKVLNKFNGKIARLRARFDPHNKGHFGGWSGSLRDMVDIYDGKDKVYALQEKTAQQ